MLTIFEIDPQSLKPRERPLRKRFAHQLGFLKSSISAYGFNEPVLTRDGKIIHGELRVLAAIEVGLKTIPAIEIEHLSPAQLRAFVIATNKIAALAGFDEEALMIELGELATLEIDLGSLGFEAAELDLLLGLSKAERGGHLDDVPALQDGPTVARPGDLWGLDQHRLYCGDALKAASYDVLLNGELAHLIVSDPPYNDAVSSISGKGKIQHQEFIQATGEFTEDQFTKFLMVVCRLMFASSVDGSLHFLFMSWRHLLALLRAGHIVYDELKNIICWVKQNGGMGSLYRSRSEYICIFKAGKAPHKNNMMLGKYGRNRTNVWEGYESLNSFQKDRDELLAMHPTVKPVDLIADIILDCSEINDLILDPFAGSGTVFLAAQKTRRRAAAMELDPRYVDVALRRFRDALGIEPIHAATGQTFSAREKLTVAEFGLKGVSQ